MNTNKTRVYPFENLGWVNGSTIGIENQFDYQDWQQGWEDWIYVDWVSCLFIYFIRIYSFKPRLGRMDTKKIRLYPFENLGWVSWLNCNRYDFLYIHWLKLRLSRMNIEKFRVYSFENQGWAKWTLKNSGYICSKT